VDPLIGTTLSHYRILALIGRGGMGDVYSARDTRLDRMVAIKVLPSGLSMSEERRRRFAREAKVISSFNHPHICLLYDIGHQDGIDFLVMEYLEGETLAKRLSRGRIPLEQSLRFASDVAEALDIAHSNGIVHRDVKPGNIMITKGRVKLLDFGLARAIGRGTAAVDGSTATTGPPITKEGIAPGTVPYMAPEQLEGGEAGVRSDVWALGATLYEMVTGKPPFTGKSQESLIAAISEKEPAPITDAQPDTPPALERVVRRCLAKDPEGRYQSARDLGFALEDIASHGGQSGGHGGANVQRRLPLAFVALGVLLLFGTHAGLFLWGKKNTRAPVPSFHRITYRRGDVLSARFTPDGQSVVYSAMWEGKPAEVFLQRLASTDAREFGLAGASVVATTGGEMDVLLPSEVPGAQRTLATVPLEGGTPRESVDSVAWADRSRDGTRLVTVRLVGARQRLECPPGKILLEGRGAERIDMPRLSPGGDRIAFVERPNLTYTAGDVVMIDLSGRKRVLSRGWSGVSGLTWSRDGREVWFTGVRGMPAALHAVTLSGKERLLMRQVGDLAVEDIASDGRVLLTHLQHRTELRGRMAGDAAERDLSWLDGTFSPNLSPDGTRMVFQVAGGDANLIYLRRMDGSSPVRLGVGATDDVSPDWKWVLVEVGVSGRIELKLVPIGAGETRTLPRGSIGDYQWARYHPDGKRIVIVGNEAGRPVRLFVQQLPDGLPRPFTPEGVNAASLAFSLDGRFVTARPPGPRAPYVLYPIEGGEPRSIPGLGVNDEPIVWSEDGGSIFVRKGAQTTAGRGVTARVVRLDVQTGRAQPWLEVTPPDGAGVASVYDVLITPNGRYYAYIYYRTLSDLYVVEGLK
jgi:eukaryotic-like serine/threonine-protein kinase